MILLQPYYMWNHWQCLYPSYLYSKWDWEYELGRHTAIGWKLVAVFFKIPCTMQRPSWNNTPLTSVCPLPRLKSGSSLPYSSGMLQYSHNKYGMLDNPLHHPDSESRQNRIQWQGFPTGPYTCSLCSWLPIVWIIITQKTHISIRWHIRKHARRCMLSIAA